MLYYTMKNMKTGDAKWSKNLKKLKVNLAVEVFKW